MRSAHEPAFLLMRFQATPVLSPAMSRSRGRSLSCPAGRDPASVPQALSARPLRLHPRLMPRAMPVSRDVAEARPGGLACWRIWRRGAGAPLRQAQDAPRPRSRNGRPATFFPCPTTPRARSRGDPGSRIPRETRKSRPAILRVAPAASGAGRPPRRLLTAIKAARGGPDAATGERHGTDRHIHSR